MFHKTSGEVRQNLKTSDIPDEAELGSLLKGRKIAAQDYSYQEAADEE